MNRILLKNCMSIMFWLYTSIILAAPVEEVRQAIENFGRKDSYSRQQELEYRKEEIIREEYHQRFLPRESNYKDRIQSLDEKKDILKKLTASHYKQELVEFIRGEVYKKINIILGDIGVEKQLSKFARGEEISEADLKDLQSKLPKILQEVTKKLASRIISEEQQRILISFIEKITNVLKSELPEKFSIDFVEQGFKLMTRSADELYQDLAQRVKSIDLKMSNKNNLFLMVLGVNILAVLMAFSKSKALNYIAYSIFVLDAVMICSQDRNLCSR